MESMLASKTSTMIIEKTWRSRLEVGVFMLEKIQKQGLIDFFETFVKTLKHLKTCRSENVC